MSMLEFYSFGLGEKTTETSAEVLGGKGAGLVWMTNQGLPVPPGFIIPTTVWVEYDKKPKAVMKEIKKETQLYLDKLTAFFGYAPLLSVRSGARTSMPGMLDTILNVGLDADTKDSWLQRLGAGCLGNSLHRLVTMYGSVVEGIPRQELEPNLMKALHTYEQHTGHVFPTALQQLLGSIEAVFKSWDNERAQDYRKLYAIPREWGTAVTVQAMVFGNLNDNSASGVLFTRNPNTGENVVTGEMLQNAQGEDIVAGVRTPVNLTEMKKGSVVLYEELVTNVKKLETLKKEVQDVEFTVQDGTLYLLQTRTAKRSATAAIRIAMDMAKEGLIEPGTAITRVGPKQFDLAQQASVDPKFTGKEHFTGIAACSGVVTGKPVFTSAEVLESKVPCILVTEETTPDDIAGMHKAVGVITMVGGLTCHAAVNARGMNTACIVGLGQTLEPFKEAEAISMDGATGRVWLDTIPILAGEGNGLIEEYSQFVLQALGAVPVIRKAPKSYLGEALLYVGDRLLDIQQTATLVLDCAGKVHTLYVDMTPDNPAELGYLGLCEGNPAQTLLDYLAMQYPVTSGHLMDRLVIVRGTGLVHPFRTLNSASDLRSLVLAEKEVVIEKETPDDEAIAKVLAWKKETGVQLVSLGSLAQGMKSIVSVEAALHLIAKAG